MFTPQLTAFIVNNFAKPPRTNPSQTLTDRISRIELEQLMLQRHVGFWSKANTSTQYIGQRSALLGQTIHNWRARGRQWSLQERQFYPLEVSVTALTFSM
jgi:hypothetical protein